MTDGHSPLLSGLAAWDLSVTLGQRTVVDTVSLDVKPGALHALIGPNGAGKTTVLKALAGLLPVDGGRVTLGDKSLDEISNRDRARRIGYLAQSDPIQWPMTVRRIVALGRLPHLAFWQSPADSDAVAIDTALALCDITHLANRPANALSGGERMRCALARALATEPSILLADEPTAGLDPRHQIQVLQVLSDRAKRGTAVVVVLHDLGLAARFCDRITLLHEGRILADGKPADVLTDEAIIRAYGVDVFRTRHQGVEIVVPWRLNDPVDRHADIAQPGENDRDHPGIE